MGGSTGVNAGQERVSKTFSHGEIQGESTPSTILRLRISTPPARPGERLRGVYSPRRAARAMCLPLQGYRFCEEQNF